MAKKVFRRRTFEGILPSVRRDAMDLKLLDLDFEDIFLPVEEGKPTDLDDSGNIKWENFVTENILKKEGIPLTTEEVSQILRPEKYAA